MHSFPDDPSLSRTLPDPGFAGDDGGVDPAVGAALAASATAPDDAELAAQALAVLQDARVLVPVVAILGEVEYDENGLAHDKSSDMAAVLITARSGRTGLLAFTGSDPLKRWNPEARPVPVALKDAAAAALQDGADALVVDLAGPAMFAVEGEALRAIASGYRWHRDEQGWAWFQTSS